VTDPLTNIEDHKAQLDIGVFGARIFQGAKSEGAHDYQAFLIVCGFYVGMFHPKPPIEEEGGE